VAWTEVYAVDASPVHAQGFALSRGDLDQAATAVRAILHDSLGADEVRTALDELTTTNFHRDLLERMLAPPAEVEEWRVGEALAEHHLVSEHECYFPWPATRDLKNPKTSSGGVDLVGLKLSTGETARFALGEVKTSRQAAWPPSVVTGRHGLAAQLEGIRDGDDRKHWALGYLAMHAVNSDWLSFYKEAFARYIDDQWDICLFGTLVHLTESKQADLGGRTHRLSVGCPPTTQIHLDALYLSPDGLDVLAGMVVARETA
jgi:hypothetical protein